VSESVIKETIIKSYNNPEYMNLKYSLGIILLIICFIPLTGCINSQSVSNPPSHTTVPVTINPPFANGDIISKPGDTSGVFVLIAGYVPANDTYQYVYVWKNFYGNWSTNGFFEHLDEVSRMVVENDHYEKTTKVNNSELIIIPKPMPITPRQLTICDEWFGCGFGFGNFQGEPGGLSERCHELYEMRINNDQRVMSCLQNPYEARANNAVNQLSRGPELADWCKVHPDDEVCGTK
jgi:hypothetical protein